MSEAFAFFDRDPGTVTLAEIPYEDLLVMSKMTKSQKNKFREKRRAFIKAVRDAGKGAGAVSSSTGSRMQQSLTSQAPGDSLSGGNQDAAMEVEETRRAVTLDSAHDSAPNDSSWDQKQPAVESEEIDALWADASGKQPSSRPPEESSGSRGPRSRISWPENNASCTMMPCMPSQKRPSPGGDDRNHKKVRFDGRAIDDSPSRSLLLK